MIKGERKGERKERGEERGEERSGREGGEAGGCFALWLWPPAKTSHGLLALKYGGSNLKCVRGKLQAQQQMAKVNCGLHGRLSGCSQHQLI